MRSPDQHRLVGADRLVDEARRGVLRIVRRPLELEPKQQTRGDHRHRERGYDESERHRAPAEHLSNEGGAVGREHAHSGQPRQEVVVVGAAERRQRDLEWKRDHRDSKDERRRREARDGGEPRQRRDERQARRQS